MTQRGKMEKSFFSYVGDDEENGNKQTEVHTLSNQAHTHTHSGRAL